MLREVYALEKIHGTSTHITFAVPSTGEVSINVFSGGIKHATFIEMLRSKYGLDTIVERFKEATKSFDGKFGLITVYGEGYGGSQQGMGKVYGPLNFVAFEVKVDDKWLDVEAAASFVAALGLPFVWFTKGPATVEWLNAQRDRPSELAARNGMGDNHVGEGIIVRSVVEMTLNNGKRLIAKHKRAEFSEHSKPREIDTAKLAAMSNAREIAEDWVTTMRLQHVLDKLFPGEAPYGMEDTPKVIQAIKEDVQKEAEGEIVFTPEVFKAIGSKAAQVFKQHVMSLK